jgi:teichuronic acid biosynthesis glycosyltransferase TuaC
MRVGLLTDIPVLCANTMYLDEIKKGLSRENIDSRIFLINSSGIFQKIDSVTGFMRIIKASKLLSQLSDCDIIHAQFTFPMGFVFTLFSSIRILNKPIIVHTHGYDVFKVPSINYGIRRNRIGRTLTSYTWKRADRIIVVCNKAKLEIESIGIQPKRIHLLYNGIDQLLFSKRGLHEIPRELSLLRSENDFIFLSIASLTPVKNHVRLINAFIDLVEKYKSKYKIKLLIIGRDSRCPSYRSDVNFRSSNNICYLGEKHHFDLPLYYTISDAFILPSLSEGHPWSMLEAMSCKLPVIASNVGGIPETLVESRFLVDPLDAQDIFKKLEMILMMDTKEREQIGTNNRDRILQSFTIEHHIDQLICIYNDVMDSSS